MRKFIKTLSVGLCLCASMHAQNVLTGHFIPPEVLKDGDTSPTWTLNRKTGVLKIEGEGTTTRSYRGYHYYHQPWHTYKDEVKTVIIGEGITEINERLFEDHENLSRVSLPQSLEIIGVHAFTLCCKLNSITIPPNVTTIKNAFGCFTCCDPERIEIINLNPVPQDVQEYYTPKRASYSDPIPPKEPTGIHSFSGLLSGEITSNIVLRVPAESLELYKSAPGWKDFEKILPIK